MDGKFLLAILFVSMVFVFGCCSLTPGENTQTPSGSNQPGLNDNTNQPGTGPSDNGGLVDNNNGGSNDLAGQTFEALMGLGVPLECDITSTYEGKSTTFKVYMKGENEVRTEIPSTSGECTKMVGIMKGKVYYIGCAQGVMFPGCDWMMFESEASDSQAIGSGFEAPDYSDVPTSKINCKPWLYDSSKFATTGNVCTMEDLMANYQ